HVYIIADCQFNLLIESGIPVIHYSKYFMHKNLKMLQHNNVKQLLLAPEIVIYKRKIKSGLFRNISCSGCCIALLQKHPPGSFLYLFLGRGVSVRFQSFAHHNFNYKDKIKKLI